MSFHQPTTTTIRRSHFSGNTYAFPVESVLKSQPVDGQLLIEASPGYVLTTPDHAEPQSQQTLSYSAQPDGSFLVRTTVTLLASGRQLNNGTVTLRDALGEVCTLTIAAKSTLGLSDSELIFKKSQWHDNHEIVSILKLTQQGNYVPVVLSTSDPSQFTLAESKTNRQFSPELTITPSLGGTYIYVCYNPHRVGQHQATLWVKTPYETQTILLLGFTGRTASWHRLAWLTDVQTKLGELVNQPLTIRIPGMVLATFLVVGGLLYAGYRCQLFPAFRDAQSAARPVFTYADTTPVNTESLTGKAIEQRFYNGLTKKVSIDKINNILVKAPVLSDSKQSYRVGVYRKPIAKPRVLVRAILPKPDAESDLEKVLNKKAHTSHQFAGSF